MSIAEITRRALPDEYCFEFWTKGLRSDGRRLQEARPMSAHALSKNCFSVEIGNNVCIGRFEVTKSRLQASKQKLFVTIENAGRQARDIEPLIDVVLSLLTKAFEFQLGALDGLSISVTIQPLLEDGNLVTAIFFCCELCVAAGLTASNIHPSQISIIDAQLFCIVEAKGQGFLLVDPNANEKEPRDFGKSEVICLIRESQIVSLLTLRAGVLSLQSLREIETLVKVQNSRLDILNSALSLFVTSS